MPTPRFVRAAAAAGGKIYAIGGIDGVELATVEKLDILLFLHQKN